MIILFTYLIGIFIFPILLVILNKLWPSLDISVDSKEKTAKLENAVEWAGNIHETVRSWLKAFNKSNLESFEISGDATYTRKELNEDQQDEAELVIISCSKAMANSLPDLINSNF